MDEWMDDGQANEWKAGWSDGWVEGTKVRVWVEGWRMGTCMPRTYPTLEVPAYGYPGTMTTAEFLTNRSLKPATAFLTP